MPLAFTITLDKELSEPMAAYRKAGPGKSLYRESERLDLAARIRKVPALTAFLSENHAALAEQMRAEGFDPSKMRLPQEQWFTAAEGLKTVRALAEHVNAHLNDFKQPNPILRDLKAAEGLLLAIEAAGVRFHFSRTEL